MRNYKQYYTRYNFSLSLASDSRNRIASERRTADQPRSFHTQLQHHPVEHVDTHRPLIGPAVVLVEDHPQLDVHTFEVAIHVHVLAVVRIGLYRVSSPIIAYLNTQLVGDFLSTFDARVTGFPTIVAARHYLYWVRHHLVRRLCCRRC